MVRDQRLDRAPTFTARMLRVVALVALAGVSLYCGGRPPTAPDQSPAPAPGNPAAPGDPATPGDPTTPGPIGQPAPGPTPAPIDPPPPGSPVFVGAGDIAPCDSTGPELTAPLLDRIGGTVFTLGDHAYPAGTREQFENCYHPTWGRHRERTRPTLGNHEYEAPGAVPYFEYFGANAGPRGRGYYSFQVGDWLAISLDSMNGGAEQTAWLRATLAASASRCTVAYWHHPFVSSSPHATRAEVRELWRILYDQGADVVLTAHEHFYERFAPQDAKALRDPERGMRQFIVGTGGAPLYDFAGVHPNSEARIRAHGVLKLTLGPASYAWEFVSVTGGTDLGADACH